MKLMIDIPKEFEENWNQDRFKDCIGRLIADSHCVAGNYEKETAEMLIDVFDKAEEFKSCENAVSRKELVEALDTWPKYGVDERGRIVNWHEGLVPYIKWLDVITALYDSPSVKPVACIAKVQLDKDKLKEIVEKALEDIVEECSDAVSRQYLLDEYDRQHEVPPGNARKIIEDAPSVRPKRPTGKWVKRECGKEDKEDGWETVIVCDKCNLPATIFYSRNGKERTQIRTHFCPNCGADMRGEK